MGYSENQYLLFIFLAFILLFVIIITLYFSRFVPFKDTRSYIKMEISRSHGDERIFWQRELKRFYVSQIPIFGKLIKKFIR